LRLALCGVTICSALVFPAAAAASQVYATSTSEASISAFSIGAGGSLSPIACTTGCKTENALSEPEGIATSPNGQFVFVANANGNGKGEGGTIEAFAVAAGGELSPIACPSDCKTGDEPWAVAVAPNGQFLYTVDAQSHAISVFSIAIDGSLSPITCTTGCELASGSEPEDVVVSPSGKFVYAEEREDHRIAVFAVAADGSLSKVTCTTGCATEEDPYGMAVSPDGRFLYAAAGPAITPFEIHPNGTLSAIPCTKCETAARTRALAISPNGRYLYTTNNNSHESSVPAFEIQANGALTPLAGCGLDYCNTADGVDPEGLVVSPGGKFVYASDIETSSNFEHGIMSAFAIGSSGELSQIGCAEPTCDLGEKTGFFGLTVTPDQGPTAAFTDTPAAAGAASTFDGSASTASSPEVSVANYEWSYGDGSSPQSAGPTPSHVYAAPGAYTVTLTVTDSGGCSTGEIYTGQTASCNGSSAATTTHTVTVPTVGAASGSGSGSSSNSGSGSGSAHNGPLAPSLTGLSETHTRWREGTAPVRISTHKRKRAPLGTIFSFSLNEAASVTLQFTETATGRRSAGKCVVQTTKNRHKRACTRTLIVGTLTLAGHTGANEVSFDGLLSNHKKLEPGSYAISATASAAGKSSTTSSLRFTIATS